MDIFSSAISTIVSGGATGILGAGISMFAKYKLQKLNFHHEEKKMELETQQMRMEQETRMAISDRESSAKESESADKLMSESYEHDKAKYATGDKAKNSKWFIFLDFFRGSVRPTVTYYLVGLTTALTYKIFALLDGMEKAYSSEQLIALVQQSILVILYITSTVVLWWFGTRSKVFMPK